MALPIKGYEGSISAGGTDVAWVSTWEVSLETEEADIGPFINDGGNTYTYTTSRSLTGTLEAVVPAGKDAGQTLLLSGAINSGYLDLVLTTTGGYTITVPSGIVSNFTMGQDAAETVTLSFDFRSNGAFTVA